MMPETLYRRRPEYAFVRSGRQVRGHKYEAVSIDEIAAAAELVGISLDAALMLVEAIEEGDGE